MRYILGLRDQRYGRARSSVIDEGLQSDNKNVSMVKP